MTEAKSKKKRIYQVAKEFHISNEALIEFLEKYHYKIRNHMAPLDDEMYTLVTQNFQKVEVKAGRETDIRKRIQEKHDKEEARREAVRQEINEILERSKEGVPEPTHVVERPTIKKAPKSRKEETLETESVKGRKEKQ